MEMPGLRSVKEVILQAIDFHKAQKLFAGRGIGTERPSMHMVFGRIYNKMMRVWLAPMAHAASINSIPLTESTDARISRAKEGIEVIPTAIIKLKSPGPSADEMTMASKIVGMASCTSMMRIRI